MNPQWKHGPNCPCDYCVLGGGDTRRAPIVCIESPFAGDVDANVDYARRCVADSLSRGESPFASHLIYTQPGVLDDTKPVERAKGILAGLEFQRVADFIAVYIDRGVSNGMAIAVDAARSRGVRVEFRTIDRVYP